MLDVFDVLAQCHNVSIQDDEYTYTSIYIHTHILCHMLQGFNAYKTIPDVVTALKQLTEFWISEDLSLAHNGSLPPWLNQVCDIT